MIEEKLKVFLAEVLEINLEEVDSNTSMDTVDAWDSLRHIMLVMELEKAFDIKLSPTERITVINYESILKIVEQKFEL